MKTYEIKYQKGSDILIVKIDATSKNEAMYLFYMNYSQDDILDIVEV